MMIQTGNDELILHIRKNYKGCEISNAWLGRKIWEWLRDNDSNAKQIRKKKKCRWDDAENAASNIPLPKTVTQFYILQEIRPRLYKQLEIIAKA